MKAIVTGASGFIGSRIVNELMKRGYDVASIGRKELEKLPKIRIDFLRGSQYIQGDLYEIAEIESKLNSLGFCGNKLQAVFHLAWGGRDRLSDLDVDAQIRNIVHTVDAYELTMRLGGRRFIFCGTMEEEFAILYTGLDYRKEKKYNRHVIYALAKVMAKGALKLRWEANAPDLIFATNSHVMGPGDDKDSFLQVALLKILRGESIIMSSGEQNFDVINVQDCAKAYVAIAERGASGSSYWIGSGAPRKLKEYIEEMNSLFASVKINYGSASIEDVLLEKSVFSIEKLTRDTGFHPIVTYPQSIYELAQFLKENHSDLRA